MDISKAIEIIDLEMTHWPPNIDPDMRKATLLGKQALKFLESARHYHWAGSEKLLPGETKKPPTPQSSRPSLNPLQGGPNEYAGKLKPNE